MKYYEWKNWLGDNTFGSLDEYEIDYYDSIINLIPNFNLKEANVIEFGFGNGSFLAYCRNNGVKISGIEIEQELIDAATINGYNAFDDVSKIPTDEKFNLVLAIDVLEHINKNEINIFFDSMKKICDSDSYFIARFPNGDSPFSLPNQNGDLTHFTHFGSSAIRYLAKRHAFEVVRIDGDIYPFRPRHFLANLNNMLKYQIKIFCNYLVSKIFLSGKKTDFISENLLIILKLSKE